LSIEVMRVHYLQHVPFETPAAILDWAEARGAEVTKTLLFEGDVVLSATLQPAAATPKKPSGQ